MSSKIKSQRLLDIVICASRAAARVVRRITASKGYLCPAEIPKDNETGAYHSAPALDWAAQSAIEKVLHSSQRGCLVVSEESLPSQQAISTYKGGLCFVVDPLDGSTFAKRRIPMSSSSVCAYSLAENKPIASAVTDVFLDKTYYTADHIEGSWVVSGKTNRRIFTSQCPSIQSAACTALGTRPDRLDCLVRQTALISDVCWLLNSGGALDICRVAAGDIDATIEFAKGFRIWDTAAAAHILRKAGGQFSTPDQLPIRLTTEPRTRFCFIAAATEKLFEEIADRIVWPGEATTPKTPPKGRL